MHPPKNPARHHDSFDRSGGISPIPPDHVHIHAFKAASIPADRFELLLGHLSSDERLRIDRMPAGPMRTEAVLSRGLLRELLSMYLDVPPSTLVFTRSEFGKPALLPSALPRMEFNISHSSGLIAYAFAADRRVGIDVERCAPDIITSKLISTVYTEEEQRALHELPSGLFECGFFSAWTRKEAYIKGTGEGLSADLKAFSITVDPRIAPKFTAGGRGWHLQSIDLCPGFAAAVAVEGDCCKIVICE